MMHGFSMAIILPSFSAHCHPIFSLITNSHSSLSIIHHHSPLSINNNHRMTILSLLAAPSCTAHSPADPKDHIEPRQGPSPPRPTGPGIWTGSQRPRRPLPTWRPPWGSSEVGRPWFAKIVPETWTIVFFSDVPMMEADWSYSQTARKWRFVKICHMCLFIIQHTAENVFGGSPNPNQPSMVGWWILARNFTHVTWVWGSLCSIKRNVSRWDITIT
jgi:hypothetical protein